MSELLSQLKSELEETRRAALERAAGTQDEALVRAMLAHTMNRRCRTQSGSSPLSVWPSVRMGRSRTHCGHC